jgi:hypothetical protein
MVSDIATFQETFADMLRNQNFMNRILYRFVRVTIVTDDGTLFRAKIAKDLRKEIRRLNPL